MKTLFTLPSVRFIRHAESEGNAGLPTDLPESICLTNRGHEQSVRLAHEFAAAPAFIVTSSYLRTQQTAAPLMARFLHVPMEIWPVHEFTYLNPLKYRGTTQSQRGVFAQSFWRSCDAHWNDGGGAESFADFMARIDDLRLRLQRWRDSPVVIFTHGYFIKGLRLRLQCPHAPVDNAFMAAFRDSRRDPRPHNAEIVTFD